MEDIRPVKLEDCNIDEKLDGLIISATDWRVIRPYCPFVLTNLSGFVKPVFKSTFKGLDFGVEESSRMLSVPLGIFDDFNVSVVGCVSKDSFPDFKVMGPEIRETQLNIVNRMFGTATYNLGGHLNKDKREVHGSDLHKFGNRLLVGMKNLFQRHCSQLFGVRILFVQLGQDTGYERTESLLKRFNLDRVCQLIIHCAIDYKIEDAVLVWNQQDLNAVYNRKRITQAYNVAFLKGVGNFYYDIKSLKDSATMKFIEIKCYSELFKNVHRIKPLPFAVPEIASDLFSPKEFSLGFCEQKNVDWAAKDLNLQVVKQWISNTSVGRSYSARCEVITSLTRENVNMRNIKRIPKALKFHPSFSPAKLSNCLRRISIQGMALHLHYNLTPFVQILMEEVDRRINSLKTGNLHVLTPDEYMKLLAAETIVCFAVYGNVQYRRGRTMYPKWLQVALEIRPRDYRLDTDFKFPRWNHSTNVDQETLAFNSSNMHVSDILQEVGERSGIHESIIDPIVNLGAFMVNWGQSVVTKEELKFELRKVAIVLIECIKKSAVYFGRKSVLKGGRKDRMIFLIKNYKPNKFEQRFVTTLEFVENLFGQKEGLESYCFLRWITGMIRFILKDDSVFLNFKSVMRNTLENELFKNNQIYPFPVTQASVKHFLIVPLAGTKKYSFKTLSLIEQNNFCELLKQFLNQRIVVKVVAQVLAEKWELDATFQKAIDRMLALMNDPRTALW